MTFTDSIPHLNIEVLDNGNIRLENESMGDSYIVDVHPIHLRHLAEKMGLVESSDPTAAKTIAMLTRRLESLSDRVHFLADYLANNSDHKHADLDYETTYARATSDIAYEFCLELDGVQPCTAPPKQATEPIKPLSTTDTHQMSIEA